MQLNSNLRKLRNTDLINLSILQILRKIIHDAYEALRELNRVERLLHLFWLSGPFVLLIERSPADIWMSLLSISFVIRVTLLKKAHFFRVYWVRFAFLFWFWCILAAILSENPLYSLGETLVWFRFPLFAMATAFWLARDSRLLYAMLLSTLIGLLLMCGILFAEILIEGQKGGRLTWPYGDLVSGNYVSKVGLPVFTMSVAVAVALKNRLGLVSGCFAFVTIIISVITGERVNFLIRACGGMLAGLVWRPKLSLFLGLLFFEIFAVLTVFAALPATAARFTNQAVLNVADYQSSTPLQLINGGIEIGKNNLWFGIGPGNYRELSHYYLADNPYARADNHPHNFYVQIFSESGLFGLCLACLFMWSIIWACFKAGMKQRDNVFIATAWVIPFGLFWPITTSADFFGQWNNIFMWSAVSIALASTTTLDNQRRQPSNC